MKRLLFTAVVVLSGLLLARAGEKAREVTPMGKETASERNTDDRPAASNRVFELRTYYTNEGKLDDLNKRFRDHTCELLKKHGADVIGFWTPTDEKDGKGDKLVYLLAFPSREAAKKTWEEFGKDPEWRKVYEESHKNGVLVKKVDSVFLEPTDYSAMK
jgi:NIPSNAP